MMTFRRCDLVEYDGERWTVSQAATASGPVALCRTVPGGPPLGTAIQVPAGEVRLITRNNARTLGKGADIDYINRQDRHRRA